jgi:D-3-phosphoglycerate dehydrogenase
MKMKQVETARSKSVVLTIENPMYDYSILIEHFRKAGISAVWKQPLSNQPEAVIERVKGFDAVLAGGDRFNREVLEAISATVKIIARFGVGYDRIDIHAARQLGIVVTNTPGRMSSPVAEMTVLMMVCLSRGLCRFNEKVKNGEWWQNYIGSQLERKTVGLVGFGQIAQKTAVYLRGFSCKILAFDNQPNQQRAAELEVEFAPLDTIAREADFLSIHVPLSQETKYMIDAHIFSLMKSSAYLINTSRGSVVKEKDLIEALSQKKIAGAALDVLETEPVLPGNPLLQFDNVILTPHIAAITQETLESAGICAADNIIAFFQGRTPENVVSG